MDKELKAKVEALTRIEEAYNMAVNEGGYTGTMQDFEALCYQAATENREPLNLDDMDKVAGGNAWDNTVEWVKENPVLTAGISAAALACVCYAAYGPIKRAYINSQNHANLTDDQVYIDESRMRNSLLYAQDTNGRFYYIGNKYRA